MGAGALEGLPVDGWTFTRRMGDVDIYRRSINGSEFPALRAHARIKASAKAVYAVISDYDHFRDFIPVWSVNQALSHYRRGSDML